MNNHTHMAGRVLGIGKPDTGVGIVEAARVVGCVAGINTQCGHQGIVQELTLNIPTCTKKEIYTIWISDWNMTL